MTSGARGEIVSVSTLADLQHYFGLSKPYAVLVKGTKIDQPKETTICTGSNMLIVGAFLCK